MLLRVRMLPSCPLPSHDAQNSPTSVSLPYGPDPERTPLPVWLARPVAASLIDQHRQAMSRQPNVPGRRLSALALIPCMRMRLRTPSSQPPSPPAVLSVGSPWVV